MELARLSPSVRFQNRAEGGKDTELHGGTEKTFVGSGGETANNFLIWGTIGVEKKNTYWEGGTPHILC